MNVEASRSPQTLRLDPAITTWRLEAAGRPRAQIARCHRVLAVPGSYRLARTDLSRCLNRRPEMETASACIDLASYAAPRSASDPGPDRVPGRARDLRNLSHRLPPPRPRDLPRRVHRNAERQSPDRPRSASHAYRQACSQVRLFASAHRHSSCEYARGDAAGASPSTAS